MTSSVTTTLYLRGVPKAVVREAKAAAAREGRSLTRWVSDRLARATGVVANLEQEADSLRTDLAWYEAHKSRLARKYEGEYVAIVDGTVVDHDLDFETLAQRVFQKFGVRSICMPRVGREEIRVRSPRRVAR
jgi:Family of unknown function (DUF5678)